MLYDALSLLIILILFRNSSFNRYYIILLYIALDFVSSECINFTIICVDVLSGLSKVLEISNWEEG